SDAEGEGIRPLNRGAGSFREGTSSPCRKLPRHLNRLEVRRAPPEKIGRPQQNRAGPPRGGQALVQAFRRGNRRAPSRRRQGRQRGRGGRQGTGTRQARLRESARAL